MLAIQCQHCDEWFAVCWQKVEHEESVSCPYCRAGVWLKQPEERLTMMCDRQCDEERITEEALWKFIDFGGGER